MYDTRQRLTALAYGAACHLGFALGIAAMVASLYMGLTIGRGPFTGATGWAFDLALLAQFALVHSFLLSARGRALLAHLAPAGIGAELRTTTFALIASLQLLLTFAAWSPSGTVWWEPHGVLRAVVSITYGASWLFLLKAMADAGLPLQTGFLGWSAVARGRAPAYRDFPARGTFRHMRQPIYLAFSLTLWTGPVWTPDHLLIATGWTLYCVLGALLKERRYLAFYGPRFARYRALVPYWLPTLQRLDTRLLDPPVAQ